MEQGNGVVVNPIVDVLLSDFCARQRINPGDKASAFESFAAFCVLNAERLDRGEFQDALTDAGEEGLDAVAIIVNGALMANPSDVDEIAREPLALDVKYVFIEAKYSERWRGGDVLKFTRAVRGFFGDADIGSSGVVDAARRTHEAVVKNVAKLEHKPSLRACYVGTGKWDDAVSARKHLDELGGQLAQLDLFSSIDCELVDRTHLRQLYRRRLEATA